MTQDARNETMRVDARNYRSAYRQGFTLIEILVVIIIIGILAALLVPAIGGAIRTAKVGRIKLEITNLAMAVETYHNKFGDYPPDFSDWGVVQRHFGSAFTRMDPREMALLRSLTHGDSGFHPAGIDRAEALVLTLGGYSSDPQHPLTGPGGPLEYVGSGDVTHRDNYQYRADRDNAFFDFDVTRMPTTRMDPNAPLSATNKLASTDESDFGTGPWPDPLPVYRGSENVAPYVYFQARTYGYIPSVGAFNGYGPKDSNGLASGPLGAVRPYKTSRPRPKAGTAAYGSLPEASKAYDFMNADTFQIISAGLDDYYGTIVDQTGGTSPVYFLFPTGQAMLVNGSASSPGEMTNNSYNGYEENSMNSAIVENGHLDNVTNFSQGKLEDEIVE